MDPTFPLLILRAYFFHYIVLNTLLKSSYVQTYISMLAFFNVVLARRLQANLALHLNILLLSALAIYTYRDVWPLATFTREPLDLNPAWFTWTSIALLTLSGVVVPILIPHEYIPIDPNVPFLTNSSNPGKLKLSPGPKRVESGTDDLNSFIRYVLFPRPHHLQGISDASFTL